MATPEGLKNASSRFTDRVNGASPTPARGATESPSRQLLHDLGLSNFDHDRSLYSELDKQQLEREDRHRQALAIAALEHQRVREEAERAAQLRVLQEERDRVHREHEERQTLLRLRAQAQEEFQHRQLVEERERREQEDRLRQIQQERVRVEEERKQIELQRKEQEEAAAEAAKNAAQRNIDPVSTQTSQLPSKTQTPEPPKPAIATPSISNISAGSQEESVHAEYIAIHQRLKAFRKQVKENRKNFPFSADMMSNLRREIQKTVGQYTIGPDSRVSNRNRTARLRDIFEEAARTATPTVDIRQFTRGPHPPGLNEQQFHAPLLLIFLVNFYAKRVVEYFAGSCGGQTELAEPVGVAAVSLFGGERLTWNGTSLFDILLAKLHISCPVVFGIAGDPSTDSGRRRLGWRKEGFPDKTFVTEQQHHERMTGIGAGFSSLALRDFSKAKLKNPFPYSNFWKAMAYIINTPPAAITSTHFVVLKGMLQHGVPRFIQFYGQAAVVALKKAILDFPANAPHVSNDATRQAVSTLKESVRRDYHLFL